MYLHCIYYIKGVDEMNATIQKWGNSQAIRLPKNILETANIKENEQVSISVEDSQIVIKKTKVHKKHISLAERLKGWDGEPYELDEEDKEWLNLKPVGNEIW